MTRNGSNRRAIVLLTAAGATVLLASLLAVRVGARARPGETPVLPEPAPQAGTVPPPKSIVLSNLPNPYCWGCSWNERAPLEFQVDLDLLAPLGTDETNAAVWFRQFAAHVRAPGEGRERYAPRKIDVEIGGDAWSVLPGDDPLLLEAEPWVDRSVCRFYPDVWEVVGMETPIPDLLMMLDLARSWVVRGKLADDPETAREDFRRAIRLGRLLRQDDVTIIQDLVAIACIRIGAEALYELARAEGDGGTMVVAALVMADKDAMRLQTASRLTDLEPAIRLDLSDPASPSVRLTDDELASVIELIRKLPERRFRMEGLIGLRLVKHLGSSAQRDTAEAALDEFANDPDELVADLAGRFRDTNLDDTALRRLIESLQ